MTDIPFTWLGFTTWIDDELSDAAEELIMQDLCRMAEHISAAGDKLSSSTYDYILSDKKVFDGIVAAGDNAKRYIERIIDEGRVEGLEKDILQKAYDEIG